MKVLISGARGLVGSEVLPLLQSRGFEVRRLVRGNSRDAIWWKPETGEINSSAFEEWRPDAIVHLAGENIAGRRWSAAQKRRIRESRVEATQRLAASLSRLPKPLTSFLSASAIGYYGSRGDEVLSETSRPGTDFLAEVTQEWEQAAEPLKRAGAKVVHLRFGMILSARGGALRKILPVFKTGLGGRIGSGKQWISWIALRDVVRVIEWALRNENAAGAYNVVSPKPVTNAEFTRTLAKVLKRPTVLPVPARALRMIFGELADALLLTSQRALPERLSASGFRFELADLEGALRAELARTS